LNPEKKKNSYQKKNFDSLKLLKISELGKLYFF